MTGLLSFLFWAVLGGIAGHVHFAWLARETQALVSGGAPHRVWLGRVLRYGLTIGVLWLASRSGALPLLAALAGLLVARHRVLRTQGATP